MRNYNLKFKWKQNGKDNYIITPQEGELRCTPRLYYFDSGSKTSYFLVDACMLTDDDADESPSHVSMTFRRYGS